MKSTTIEATATIAIAIVVIQPKMVTRRLLTIVPMMERRLLKETTKYKSLAALVNQVKGTVRGAITFASDMRGNLLNAENNPWLSVEGFIFGYTGS